MSVWVLSKADIDAYVTVALRWTERGVLADWPADVRDVLTVTRENATEVGRQLWLANHNSFNYGGPPEFCDPERLSELLEFPEQLEVMPDYEFEEFRGFPAPESAVRRAHYYLYQTASDHWEEGAWPNGQAPFEMRYTLAMDWAGRRLVGGPASRDEQLRYGWESPGDGMDAFPKYEASGWGLSDEDRDLFERVA